MGTRRRTSPSRSRLAHRGWPVLLAGSVAAGAWVTVNQPSWPGVAEAGRVPLVLVGGGAALAALRLHPLWACAAAVALASVLAHRSLDGLDDIQASRRVQAEVTLVSDPRPTRGDGARAEVRLDGRRLALQAYRSPAAAVEDRLTGERLLVVGEVRPPGPFEQRMPHRHLAGRLQVDVVVGWRPGHAVTQAANGLRRTLAGGVEALPERHQALFAGLILGDTRHQPPDLTEAFREAGLAHLLAISGDNVACVMVLASPLLQRLRLAPRLIATLGFLAFFALLTRGEPSVLRATAMAGVGAYSTASGQPSTGRTRLAYAVTGLLLVDPLLVMSLGFRLSVAGTAGIVVLARPIADRLPGPGWLRLPLAVSMAAELAVAPLLVGTFGSVPLVSLPANLLAAPAAAGVKVWGMAVGLVAGLAGDPVAAVLHLPTAVMLSWLDRLATAFAVLPVGDLHAGHLVVLTASTAAIIAARRVRAGPSASALRTTGATALQTSGSLALVGVLLAALLSNAAAPLEEGQTGLGPGMELWRGGGAVVLIIDGRATNDAIAQELAQEQVTRVDVLILRTPADRAVSLAASLIEAQPHLQVLAPPALTSPPDERLPHAATPHSGTTTTIGGLTMTFDIAPDRLNPRLLLAEAGTGASQ